MWEHSDISTGVEFTLSDAVVAYLTERDYHDKNHYPISAGSASYQPFPLSGMKTLCLRQQSLVIRETIDAELNQSIQAKLHVPHSVLSMLLELWQAW